MFKKDFYTVKNISLLALVAALYVALSLLISPLSFGAIQFRFSEILILLVFFRKEYALSLVLGCFITNLFSPFALDLILGTLHTLISVLFIAKTKNLLLASLWPTIFSFIVGYELYLYGEPFIISTLCVMMGEFVVITIIGVPLFKSLKNNNHFKKFITEGLKK